MNDDDMKGNGMTNSGFSRRGVFRAAGVAAVTAAGVAVAGEPARADAAASAAAKGRRLRAGADVAASDGWRMFAGRKVGIITNPTGVLEDFTSIVDAMVAAGVDVTAVFGPEHGFRGTAQAVVLPRSTDDVSKVIALCAARQVPVVPQGGNTSVCGGSVPDAGPAAAIVLSLSRLNRIRAIVAAGVPVVGHVGLTPQTATALGGLRAQGRTESSAARVVEEALGVQRAGAFCVVVEAVPAEVTAVLREVLDIPIIGIGAGPADGQVLVVNDLLGVTEGRTAKFVKTYGSIGDDTVAAISAYADEVRSGAFPGTEHQYAATHEAVAAARESAERLRQ